jgi:hypothetical protein
MGENIRFFKISERFACTLLNSLASNDNIIFMRAIIIVIISAFIH